MLFGIVESTTVALDRRYQFPDLVAGNGDGGLADRERLQSRGHRGQSRVTRSIGSGEDCGNRKGKAMTTKEKPPISSLKTIRKFLTEGT